MVADGRQDELLNPKGVPAGEQEGLQAEVLFLSLGGFHLFQDPWGRAANIRLHQIKATD